MLRSPILSLQVTLSVWYHWLGTHTSNVEGEHPYVREDQRGNDWREWWERDISSCHLKTPYSIQGVQFSFYVDKTSLRILSRSFNTVTSSEQYTAHSHNIREPYSYGEVEHAHVAGLHRSSTRYQPPPWLEWLSSGSRTSFAPWWIPLRLPCIIWHSEGHRVVHMSRILTVDRIHSKKKHTNQTCEQSMYRTRAQFLIFLASCHRAIWLRMETSKLRNLRYALRTVGISNMTFMYIECRAYKWWSEGWKVSSKLQYAILQGMSFQMKEVFTKDLQFCIFSTFPVSIQHLQSENSPFQLCPTTLASHSKSPHAHCGQYCWAIGCKRLSCIHTFEIVL